MPSGSGTSNPFYALVVAVSVAFSLSACAYGVMAVRNKTLGQQTQNPESGRPLIEVFERYGTAILLIELVVLAVVVAAAIGTDAYRKRRAVASVGRRGHGILRHRRRRRR